MKTLPYNKAKIEEIIKTYPTPFHIYYEKGIKDAAHKLQRAFSLLLYNKYMARKCRSGHWSPPQDRLKVCHLGGFQLKLQFISDKGNKF